MSKRRRTIIEQDLMIALSVMTSVYRTLLVEGRPWDGSQDAVYQMALLAIDRAVARTKFTSKERAS